MNTALTNVCNFNCPYCFASEIRSEEKVWITEEQFNEILNFHKVSNQHEVRFIGGEPTLHPEFTKLLNRVVNDDYFTNIMLFTNGSFSDEVASALILASHVKHVACLINLNEPQVVGPAMVEKTSKNLSKITRSPMEVTIGVNIYRPDQDVSYAFDTIKMFNVRRALRISVVAPILDKDREKEPLEYYNEYKPLILDIANRANKEGITLSPDCSFIPPCLFSKEELLLMSTAAPDMFSHPVCEPVLDVMPDGTVVRCFDMSHMRTNIRKFENAGKVAEYFREQEMRTLQPITSEACETCPVYFRYGFGCGCKSFDKHANKIKEVKEVKVSD